MALETFLSTAEIDALFESSYLSYVSQMKSTVSLQNSTFEPASAKRTRESASNSDSSVKRRKKVQNLEEQDVDESAIAIKDEAFLFYALPDKRLSKETNRFVQKYNKDKSLLYKSPTIDDVGGVDNVIHKSGDLPCERYLAIACRKFENIVSTNDKSARMKSVAGKEYEEQEQGTNNINLRSKHVALITKAGEEFVNDLMKIMFNYKGNINLNRLFDSKFNVSMFDDAQQKNDKNNKIIQKMDFGTIKEIENFYNKIKVTEQGFLGLKKKNLMLYDEMHRQKTKKKYYKMFKDEEIQTERNLKLFNYDLKTNRILNNVIGAIPLVKDLETVELFYKERRKKSTNETIKKIKEYFERNGTPSDEKVNLFELFTVDESKMSDSKGILSMDMLLHYLYNYYLIYNRRDLDDTTSDEIVFKEKFVKYVNSYKDVERKKTLTKIGEILIRPEYQVDPLLEYLETMQLEKYLMVFSKYDSPDYNNFDVFKLLFEIDKHLSRSLRIQYYKNNKIIAGDIIIEDKNPSIKCMTDLNKFFKQLNIDLKNFWNLLNDNLKNDSPSTPNEEACNRYGIKFPEFPDEIEEDEFQKIQNSDFGFLQLYLGEFDIMKKQTWKKIGEFLSDEDYRDFFEDNIDSDSILKYMFDSNFDNSFKRLKKKKQKKRKVDIDMLVKLYNSTNAYAFSSTRTDKSNFADNLWDYFSENFEGLFESYKRYSLELSSLSKIIDKIGGKAKETDVTAYTDDIKNSYTTLIELNKKIITKSVLETLNNVKTIKGKLFSILQYVYAYRLDDSPQKVKDLSSYTNVDFPLTEQVLEEIRLYYKPFVGDVIDQFDQTTDWEVDKTTYKNLGIRRKKEIEKRIDSRVEKMQNRLDQKFNSGLKNSYEDQLGKSLYILNFNIPEGKKFYDNVKEVKIINPLYTPKDKKTKDNMSFFNFLEECLGKAQTANDDTLPDTFRRLQDIDDQTKQELEIFPMFFNKYEYPTDKLDSKNQFIYEDLDYRIAETEYDPENKMYLRKRFLFYSNRSTTVGDYRAIDIEAKKYIRDLIAKIQSVGSMYKENKDEKYEKILEQHTRDLNVMLTLYNFNDATAVRTCVLLFYIVATSFQFAENLVTDAIRNDLNNWDKSTKVNAAALLRLFCSEKYNNQLDLKNGLETLIRCWWTDRNTSKKTEVNFTPSEIQQAVEGKTLFGLVPRKNFQESPTVSDVVESNSVDVYTSISDKIKVDYNFKVDGTVSENKNLLNVRKELLENEDERNKRLIDIFLDSKLQLELCAYKQIVDAMSFELEDKFQEEKEEGKKRRIRDFLQSKDLINSLIIDFGLDTKKLGQLPTPYNNDLQKYRLEKDNEEVPEDLLVYEKGDLVIYNDFVYEYLFDSKNDDIVYEELLLPDEDDPQTMFVWHKLRETPLSKKELTALAVYIEERAVDKKLLNKILPDKKRKRIQKIDENEDDKNEDRYFTGEYYMEDKDSLNMLKHRMRNVLPKNYRQLEYIITSLIENNDLQKTSEGNQIIDSFNSSLKNLYNSLTTTQDFNISSWFSRRVNVFHDKNMNVGENILYTDFELLYGTRREDIWNLKDKKQVPVKGILNYSYAESKEGGFKQDSQPSLKKMRRKRVIDYFIDDKSEVKKDEYLFSNLEDIADWVKKDGQEDLFYSRNYVEQLKTLLKDFLFLAEVTTDEYDLITKEELITNNQSNSKETIKNMNSYCRLKTEDANTTLNKKLQLYCKFHTHLSKVVFGLKLQVLKLYNEGICETTDYDRERRRGVARYNILFNELSTNLKNNFQPRKDYLDYLKEDKFNNPNNTDNSHIERRRNRYKSWNRRQKEKISWFDLEDVFVNRNAMLPDWFYNRVLDTYAVFNQDIETIVSNEKIPFKFEGFNFALLLEDALQSSSENVYEYFDGQNNNLVRYTETFWNKQNKNKIDNMNDFDRDKELEKPLQNSKLSDLEKGFQSEQAYSMVRDYRFRVFKAQDENVQIRVVTQGNKSCIIGIQEFVNELNHHLFLEDDNKQGKFLKEYLWNIYDFECQKYEHENMLNQINITKDYIFGDGYDKDLIVYRYNEKKKINYNKEQHGNKVAEYKYPKDGYIEKAQKKSDGVEMLFFQERFFLTSKGNLFYNKVNKGDKINDTNALEIYKSPSLVINTLTVRKKFPETFYIMSKNKNGDNRWVGCYKKDLKDTCAFYDTDKNCKFMSSYYYGIDTTLTLIKSYIEKYKEKVSNEKWAINTNEVKEKVASFFLTSFQHFEIVLENLKKWFLKDNKQSKKRKQNRDIYKFNKFQIVTPTVNYMGFFKDMHYKYKSLKIKLHKKYFKKKMNKLRKHDLENYYVTSLIEDYNDELNVYKNKLQTLEYCMLARYGNNKSGKEPDFPDPDTQKKQFIKSLSRSMFLDALIQRNSVGDKLIQDTFFNLERNSYVFLGNTNVESVDISDIVNFEDACLKSILKKITESINKRVTVMKEIQKFDVRQEIQLQNGKETDQTKTKKDLNKYLNEIQTHMQEFIKKLLYEGKENTSLQKFKVDLYPRNVEDRRKFQEKLKILYFKNEIVGKDVTFRLIDGSSQKLRGKDVLDWSGSGLIKMKNDDNFFIDSVYIPDSELKTFAKNYINDDILIQKFQQDDILLADVDFENRDSELLEEYDQYYKNMKYNDKAIELQEIFHLFCGIEDIDGKIEVDGILYYLQVLYKLIVRERQKICNVHEGCQCVVVKSNGEKDENYNETHYTVEEILDATDNEQSKLCTLRDSSGEIVRDTKKNIVYVEIEKLVNLNKTTSQPFYTVVSEVNENEEDFLNPRWFRYTSKHKTKKSDNSIQMLLDANNKTSIQIEESKLVSPDYFILLAQNQVGAYNGSDLDIFYNIKLLAMEKQLNDLLAVLVAKLNRIEKFLLNQKIIIKANEKRVSSVYKSLFKAVQDEQDLIAFWKVENTLQYDYKQILEDKNNLEVVQKLLYQGQEKKLDNNVRLTIKDIKDHYENNKKALTYKKNTLLLIKNKKDEEDLLLIKNKEDAKEEEKKTSTTMLMPVLELPSETATKNEVCKENEAKNSDTANVFSKMIKLML